MAQHDVEIGKIICSTNAVESLNGRYRRAIWARGHFPTAQAALKLPLPRHPFPDPTGRDKTRWAMRWKPDIDRYTVNSDSPDERVDGASGGRDEGGGRGRTGRSSLGSSNRPPSGAAATRYTRSVRAVARVPNPESLDPLHDLVPHIGLNWCPLNGGNRHGALARPASPGGVQRLRQVQLLSAASGN